MVLPPFFLNLHHAIVGLLMLATVAFGQQVLVQPTPFSTFIDLQAAASGGSGQKSLPIWFESVGKITGAGDHFASQKTTYRIRFRRFGALNAQLQIRLFFSDLPGYQPVVTGWAETGAEHFRSSPLGTGLGLPTSESLIVPGENLDYLEVSCPGDGKNVRGIFLATLKKFEGFRALDYATPEPLVDPFGNLPPVEPQIEDRYLYGRVKAALEPGTLVLTPADARTVAWHCEIDAVPMLAVASFEVLDADPLSPPVLIINGRAIGPASVFLPDLADPGFQATVRPGSSMTRFQYNGWLRAQVTIPPSALRGGLNTIVLRVDNRFRPVAVRAVELQLKHHWQHLDYQVTSP